MNLNTSGVIKYNLRMKLSFEQLNNWRVIHQSQQHLEEDFKIEEMSQKFNQFMACTYAHTYIHVHKSKR